MGRQVELVFSACDGVMIDKKYLGSFWCNEIMRTVRRVASNSVLEGLYCGELFLEVHKSLNMHPSSWDMYFEPESGRPGKSETPVFDRIVNTPDITAVRILYEDDSLDYIFVPWEDREDNRYQNGLQESAISAAGHLYLSVSRKNHLADLVDLDEIHDEARAFDWTVSPD